MSYKPADAYYGEFTTQNPTTGAATAATGTPVATATHNGTDDAAFVLTVTSLATGRYKVTGTIPSGYVSGDTVSISVTATVSGVAGAAVIDSFPLDGKRVSDLTLPAVDGSGRVTPVPGTSFVVQNPVGTNGNVTLVRGRDYKNADGLALSLINAAGTWPNLTGAASITLYVKSTQTGLVAFSVVGSSPVPAGANQSVRFDVTAAGTAAIPATGNVFPYSYEVVAVLADGDTVSLQTGSLFVQPNASS